MPVKITKKDLLNAVGVILRVPGLFIAEAWYRSDPITMQQQYASLEFEGKMERPDEMVFIILYYSALVLSLSLIVLPLKRLVHLYMYLLSGFLMLGAHYLSLQFAAWEQLNTEEKSLFEDNDRMQKFGLYLMTQGVVSAMISYLIDLKAVSRAFLLVIYTAPMWARVVGVPAVELNRIHNISTLAAVLSVMLFSFNNIPILLDYVKTSLRQLYMAVQLYGWIAFMMTMWFKILLPVQFLAFWCILFLAQLYKYLSISNHPILAEGWLVVFLASIGECCASPMSLVGLCITVSYTSHIMLTLTKLFLQGGDAIIQDNVMHHGWTEGFTMFLLAMQTGITELQSPQRAFLMSIVLFIVISSLIQSMFEVTDPFLLGLGASQNKNIFKHVRAISMCTFLWMMPLYMTFLICQFFDLDFWLMVVVSSCVLTSVQVVGSLVVYALFIYDAVKQKPLESIDDMVYYAKATTRVLEFIVALFVVCYGINESLFGEWSVVNSSILIIHFYFNVWQRLQVGWKTYLLRREAAKKIESLPIASSLQLSEHNDVCPICYQELLSARITPCKHYFHAICLRKWLYVQEYCPLCHHSLVENDFTEAAETNFEEGSSSDTSETQTDVGAQDGAQGVNHVHSDNEDSGDISDIIQDHSGAAGSNNN